MKFTLSDPLWYELEPKDKRLASRLIDTVMDIDRRQVSITEGNRRHARIYSGYLPNGLANSTLPTSNARLPFAATKALIRSVCDTAHAMIVRSRPKTSIVTDGANFDVQRQAEQLDQYMVGAYQQGGLYHVAPRSFHDSTIFGTGGWKYVPRGTGDKFKVCYERVLINDIVVDEDECREHLEPDNIYHRMVVRTDAVIRKYCPGTSEKDRTMRAAIQSADRIQGWTGINVPQGYTVLVDACHVDCENESEGRRILCVPNAVILDTTWEFEWHPYTWLWWQYPITGFYGDGIAYRQYGRQERITYMHRWIARVFDQFATPTAWLDPASGPPTLQMSNEIGKVIMARKPPTFQTQALITPEVYRWLDKLETDGYEDEGISQVSAANQLPPGIESAPAQREYSFKESQRFAPVSQRWEEAIAVETAQKTTALCKKHFKSSGSKPTARFINKKLMYQIEWPDLDENSYLIRAEASSLESLSPSARLQGALELAQTGWIGPKEGRAIVGHPDLREADRLDNAGESYAKFILGRLMKGEAPAVDTKADLDSLKRVVRAGRLLAIEDNASVEITDEMDRYLDDLDNQMDIAQKAAMAGQMPPEQPTPGISSEAAQGRPSPFAGKSGYT